MKTKLLVAFVALLCMACGSSREEMEAYEKAKADSVMAISGVDLSSSAAVEKHNNSSRKFLRTADIKFKVGDVIKSTYYIENVVNKFGGFVTYTNLYSTINDVSSIKCSEDSLLKTTHYTVNNSITLRVPNTQLDTTLKSIALVVDFLDYRLIKADDVALQILSNQLTQKRATKGEAETVITTNKKGRAIEKMVVTNSVPIDRQEQADNAYVNNLDLNDKVNYSTVTLTLYQNESIKSEKCFVAKNIEEYESSFFEKLGQSLLQGLSFLQGFILLVVKLWPLFVISLIILVLLKKYK